MSDSVSNLVNRYNHDATEYFEDDIKVPKVFNLSSIEGEEPLMVETKSFSQVGYISLSNQLNAEEWVKKSYRDNYLNNKANKTGTRAWFILNEDLGIEVYNINYKLIGE